MWHQLIIPLPNSLFKFEYPSSPYFMFFFVCVFLVKLHKKSLYIHWILTLTFFLYLPLKSKLLPFFSMESAQMKVTNCT